MLPLTKIHTYGEIFSSTRKYNSMSRGVILYLLETIADVTKIVQENKIKNKRHFNLFKVNTVTKITA